MSETKAHTLKTPEVLLIMASQDKNVALIEAAKCMKHVPWCEDYERMISGMLYGGRLIPHDTLHAHSRGVPQIQLPRA